MKIYLSAGHNNKGKKIDSGAVANGYHEADINIEFRNLLIAQLKKSGITIIQDKDYQTLSEYLESIKPSKDNFVLEIHCDASSMPNATGTTAIISMQNNGRAKQIATQLVNTTSEILQIRNRGVFLENQTFRKKLALLQESPHSCVLELFFLTNKKDLEQYQKHKITLARELAKLIIKHLKSLPLKQAPLKLQTT